MDPSEVAGVIGAFALVVLLFSWLRLRLFSSQASVATASTAPEEDLSAADEVAQARFRDEMMERLRERWEGELEMAPSDAISFTLKVPDQQAEEPMLVVLVNLYSGCLKYPGGEEKFKRHFLEELVRTMRKHTS